MMSEVTFVSEYYRKIFKSSTFLYVVSPEASTPLCPIFFPRPGWPEDDAI